MDYPEESISLKHLRTLGVEYWNLDSKLYEKDPALDKIRKERNYSYSDIVYSKEIPDLEEKLDRFKKEHLHEDEEIRYFIEGSGYFDLRDGKVVFCFKSFVQPFFFF